MRSESTPFRSLPPLNISPPLSGDIDMRGGSQNPLKSGGWKSPYGGAELSPTESRRHPKVGVACHFFAPQNAFNVKTFLQ